MLFVSVRVHDETRNIAKSESEGSARCRVVRVRRRRRLKGTIIVSGVTWEIGNYNATAWKLQPLLEYVRAR